MAAGIVSEIYSENSVMDKLYITYMYINYCVRNLSVYSCPVITDSSSVFLNFLNPLLPAISTLNENAMVFIISSQIVYFLTPSTHVTS